MSECYRNKKIKLIIIIIMPLIPLLALLLFFLSVLLSLLSNKSKNIPKYNLPPGPPPLPLIGNLHLLDDLIHHSLHKLSTQYGPLVFLKLGTVPIVVASSADLAREFLKTHDLDCCSRPPLASLEQLTYGFRDIAFSPYDQQWRELRKVCILHLFNSKKVASFRWVREEEVGRMLSSISSRVDTQVIDLSEEMMAVANNITCASALGKRYGNGEGRLLEILRETQALFVAFFLGDYVPLMGWVDVVRGMRRRLERNFADMDGFYQEVIDEHRDARRRWKEERKEDAVDALLDMQQRDPNVTDDHIKGVLMNIFIAGSDTSSAVVEWAMTELMKNSQVMAKAQHEVRHYIGNKGKVEESDLDQLKYLKAVIKETMRLHPPAPLLVQRETIRHCTINGFDIPAKTRLFINIWTIGRDANIWERPEEFIPDRFVDCSIDFIGHDFQLIPFGAGRRICPGMQQGNLVVELALANLLYLYNWELPKGMMKEKIDMGEVPGVTVHKKEPLLLVATKYCV